MRTVSGGRDFVVCKVLKWQALHGSLLRRLVIRTLFFGIAISMLPLLQLLFNDVDPFRPGFVDPDECNVHMGYLGPNSYLGRVLKPVIPLAFPHLRAAECAAEMNLTLDVARELMGKQLLNNYGARALCVGKGSILATFALRNLGFANVDAVYKHPFLIRKQKQALCELEYDDDSFDFVLTRDLDRFPVPAFLVNEVERILKPGGIGAMLVSIEGSSHGSVIRSAAPISSFLKTSDVMHVASLDAFTLVAFRKRFNDFTSFKQYRLPSNCPSIDRNKPFINKIEPLMETKPIGHEKGFAYLPNFTDVSPKGKLIYVDMGARDWFLPSYPIDMRAFNVFIVDHDALVLSSHVKNPGVTFIYLPALAGRPKNAPSVQDIEIPVDEEEFDFLVWFKETVEFADFVVLRMNVGRAELKFLFELFESGAICAVDELFLQCSDSDNVGFGGSCIDLFNGLRDSGVFVHRWWGN